MSFDRTSPSREFSQDGGSARGWADRTIGIGLLLNDERREFVYAMIGLLDRQVRSDRN